MKSLKEQLNESVQINESFLSVGLTIIVALILARFTFKGILVIRELWKGIKMGVETSKEYFSAIKSLDELLTPYKDELLKTEWGSKLFDPEGLITAKSVKEKGCSIVYMGLSKDIKSVLSEEDYNKYEKIIKTIYNVESPRI